jgi:DNA polymerase (family 10)
MMSINPDAHSTDELDLTHWGVEMARKGGVPADRVLNCLPLKALRQFFDQRKKRTARAARPGRLSGILACGLAPRTSPAICSARSAADRRP